MAGLLVETIWHFIGYLHLPQSYNVDPLHYSGAKAPATFPYAGIKPVTVDKAESIDRPGPSAPLDVVSLQTTPPLQFDRLSLQIALPSLPESMLEPFKTIGPPVLAPPSLPGLIEPGPLIFVSYSFGGDNDFHAQAEQANALIDNDVINDDTAVPISTIVDPDALNELIDTAEALVPADAISPSFEIPGVSFERITDETASQLELGSGSNSGLQSAELGRYIDNEKQATGETVQDQLAAIDAAIARAKSGPPSAELPVETHHLVDQHPLGPTEGRSEIAFSGRNEQLNAAVISDYHEIALARVVMGDYRESNVILQLNVLADDDVVQSPSTDIAHAIAGATGNSLLNEASFLAGGSSELVAGFLQATSWHVTVVSGDVIDVSAVFQHNYLMDNDAIRQTESDAHYVAVSGDNRQLNISQFMDLGQQYDLIIVQGNYYGFNSIVQINIMNDSDSLNIATAGNHGDPSASTGGNLMHNDAAILNVGDNSFMPLVNQPALLASAIAGHDEVIDGELAGGLPGNGTSTYSVLLIEGDYYDINQIIQTNILFDADTVQQSGLDRPDDLAGPLEQSAETGDNSQINTALIVDFGPISGYQFVQGEHFSETLLLQADIVSNDDRLSNGQDTADPGADGDLLATIAAISGVEDINHPSLPAQPPPAGASAAVDIVGSIMH